MAAMVSLSRFTPVLFVTLMLTGIATLPASAQNLIRDAEIERALQELANPIISAAGLNPNRVKVMIVNDPTLNAFVVDTAHVFIYSGLLLKLKNADEVQAVISHEVAHIANGHIARRTANIRTSKTAAGLGLLLAAATAAAGQSDAAAGIAIGAASSAKRVLLAHTRAEESSADQSGARYLARAGVSPEAMVRVLDIFRGQEALSTARQDPYVRSHPLTRDRLRAVKGYATAYKPSPNRAKTDVYWYNRAQAKLSAFLRNPGWTLKRIEKSDTSELGLMQKAVAYHRFPDRTKAVATVNALIAKRPKDPYYNELKGQILLESRQFSAAVTAYAKAVALAPRQPLILAGYGRALLARGDAAKAMGVLEKARARDPFDTRMLRDLATAYAKNGKNGMASVVTAERYALMGRIRDAEIHAQRASDLLPRGSSGWTRAQDVLLAARFAQQKKKRGWN